MDDHDRETTKLTPKRVLIVEDDAGIGEALETILLDEGYIPTTAQHGEQALVELGRGAHAPGLILLDLMLPDIDGVGLVDRIRADDRFVDVPVVVISASNAIAEASVRIGA